MLEALGDSLHNFPLARPVNFRITVKITFKEKKTFQGKNETFIETTIIEN